MLRHIEAVARVGFTCELPGLGVVTCKPFVTSLLVDTKERWQFCCLRGERCCAWCRIRKGRSLFRVSTPHCLAQVQREWALADSTTVSAAVRAGARSRLQRWGFHARRRSCFIEVCRESRLGPGPDGGGEVFGGTAGVDVMHGLYIKMTRELFAVLRLLCKTGKHAVALDEAIKTLRFRDPTSGTRSRGVEGISSDLGVTAERRVHLLFALGAVLGTTGSILRHTQAMILGLLGLEELEEESKSSPSPSLERCDNLSFRRESRTIVRVRVEGGVAAEVRPSGAGASRASDGVGGGPWPDK